MRPCASFLSVRRWVNRFHRSISQGPEPLVYSAGRSLGTPSDTLLFFLEAATKAQQWDVALQVLVASLAAIPQQTSQAEPGGAPLSSAAALRHVLEASRAQAASGKWEHCISLLVLAQHLYPASLRAPEPSTTGRSQPLEQKEEIEQKARQWQRLALRAVAVRAACKASAWESAVALCCSSDAKAEAHPFGDVFATSVVHTLSVLPHKYQNRPARNYLRAWNDVLVGRGGKAPPPPHDPCRPHDDPVKYVTAFRQPLAARSLDQAGYHHHHHRNAPLSRPERREHDVNYYLTRILRSVSESAPRFARRHRHSHGNACGEWVEACRLFFTSRHEERTSVTLNLLIAILGSSRKSSLLQTLIDKTKLPPNDTTSKAIGEAALASGSWVVALQLLLCSGDPIASSRLLGSLPPLTPTAVAPALSLLRHHTVLWRDVLRWFDTIPSSRNPSATATSMATRVDPRVRDSQKICNYVAQMISLSVRKQLRAQELRRRLEKKQEEQQADAAPLRPQQQSEASASGAALVDAPSEAKLSRPSSSSLSACAVKRHCLTEDQQPLVDRNLSSHCVPEVSWAWFRALELLSSTAHVDPHRAVMFAMEALRSAHCWVKAVELYVTHIEAMHREKSPYLEAMEGYLLASNTASKWVPEHVHAGLIAFRSSLERCGDSSALSVSSCGMDEVKTGESGALRERR